MLDTVPELAWQKQPVALLGIPLDENSSFLRGSAQAPPVIREALHSYAANLCAESGLDLGQDQRWREATDLHFARAADHFAQIEAAIGRLLAGGERVLSLGGDHAITYPILRAYGAAPGRANPGLTLVQIDAHPDLYDELAGNRHSHACPFARIMEQGLVQRLIQIGIRTMTPHQQAQAERFGVEVINAADWHDERRLDLAGPVYLSIDLDGLDPAYAPGVAHHEPGGLSSRQVIGIIQQLQGQLVGADIVEFNPSRDLVGMTATLSAKLVKELLSAMLL